eukprot:3888113-Alexandrium_andersonii.AAC.1
MPEPAEFVCEILEANGEQCSLVFSSRQVLAVHQANRHAVRPLFRQLIITSQCAWCEKLFFGEAWCSEPRCSFSQEGLVHQEDHACRW